MFYHCLLYSGKLGSFAKLLGLKHGESYKIKPQSHSEGIAAVDIDVEERLTIG